MTLCTQTYWLFIHPPLVMLSTLEGIEMQRKMQLVDGVFDMEGQHRGGEFDALTRHFYHRQVSKG